ncbi:MAG: hypothetical protein R8K46_05570 [Mariprofundaceae bacterium]
MPVIWMGRKPLSDSRQALLGRLYVLISLMVAVPALSWPMAFGRLHLEVMDWVTPGDLWRLALVSMVLVVIVADTLLAGVGNRLSMMIAAAWIAGSYLAVFLALQMPAMMGVYVLACLLAIHSTRSAWRLCLDGREWWLWPAWMRDTAVSFGVFAWFL